MFSRFTSLLNSTNNYSKDHIDEIVSLVKKLGRTNGNNDGTELSEIVMKTVLKILQIMKKYSQVVQIQRVCCHALSNLAMHVNTARYIMDKNGFKLLKNALIRFENDHKLCWLGSSAIWNLARPPANRQLIGKTGVSLMLKILKKHNTKEKVTNTTIGALSNLSLCDELKNIIAKNENIDILLSVLNGYCNRNIHTVLTSGSGLLANLAVSDDHANTLVNRNALPMLMNVLSWGIINNSQNDKISPEQQQQNETLFRNACAALNNMVTAENFIAKFLNIKATETVYDFLKVNNSELYTGLLENCLLQLECNVDNNTTSYHLASHHNKLNILKDLIRDNENWNMNQKDSKGLTCLDYAVNAENAKVVEFLCKLGAQSDKMEDIVSDGSESDVVMAMEKGNGIRNKVIIENKNAVDDSLHRVLPKDLNHLIASYHGVMDMLVATDQF